MSESQPTAHAQSQPDDHPTIQDFLSWIEAPAARRSGRGDSNNDVVREYIPRTTLEQKLTRGKVEELLDTLFKDCEYPAPEANYVMKHYLRAFAILLRVGQGRMIHHFCEYQSLQDGLLPFLMEPPNFPKSTGCNLFAEFRHQQWAFCAVRLEYDIRSHLEPDEILPIPHIECIEEGGSAIAYKIKVDPEYDELVPKTVKDPDAQEEHCNTYVIKTYRSQEAQAYYTTERRAFEKLRYDGLPPANIIGFYGSFVRQRTYNIILEFADLGNLDQYMQRISPPSSAEDKMMFWERFLEVGHGLATIHGEDEHTGDGPQILLGWHQDVNPSNILVKSRRGKSVYDCHFKLADLGLSHFKKYTSPLRDATDVDTWGTNAYGAPETRRTNVNLEKSKLKVRQDVDIWSMGCVYSEVTTWVDQSWNKVGEYRRRRSQEIEKKTSRSEESFHDGEAVLEAVRQIHYDIVNNHRRNDFVTPKVVEKLVDKMLLVGTARPAAINLYNKSRRILYEAYRELEKEPSYPISPTNVRRPPVEPNSATHGCGLPPQDGPGTGSILPNVRTLDTCPVFRGMPPHRRFSSALNGDGVPYMSSQDHPDHTQQYGWSGTAITYPTLVQRKNEYDYRHPDHNVDHPHRVPNESGGYQRSRLEPNEPSPQLPIHSGPWPRHAEGSTNSGKAFDQSGNQQQFNPISSHSPFTSSAQGWSQAVSESTTPKFGTAGFAKRGDSRLVEDSHGTPAPGPDAPHMTVEEGLFVKQQRELGKKVRFPPEDHDLLDSLHQRDHAFLIDNSNSMETYRPQVRKVLGLLSYMLGPTDPDGLDIYFTTYSKKLKPGDSYAMQTEYDNRHATGFLDITHRFANILEDYQKRFGKRNVFSRIRHPNSTPSKGPRKYTLYVLTDGAWHQSVTLVDEMKTLVKHMVDHNIPNNHIGIQFIRFGNNPQGIRRLKRLDSKRRLGVARDLVDTEPADGNVWKMLLGPLNRVFDNDTEDEYDEDDDDDNENDNDYRDEKGLSIKGLGSQKGKGKRQRSGTQRSDQTATR